MRRLATSLVLVVLLATLGAGWALDRLFVRIASTEPTPLALYRSLAYRYANAIDESVVAESDDGFAPDTLPDDPRDSGDSGVLVRRLPADALLLDENLHSELAAEGGLALETADGVTLYFALPNRGELLAIDYPLAGERLPTLRLVLTIVFYAALILLTLAWLLPLLRRLAGLAAASRALGQGDLTQRVDIGGGGELRDVELAFNNMAGRIERLVDDNRLLSRAVSHDLKTPLARLRFGIDSLRERSDPDSEQGRHLARIEADVESMERLVNVMLEFARFDARLSRLPRATFELASVVSDSVARTRLHDEHRLEWQPPSQSILLDGQAPQLGMLIDNLLSNALRHAQGQVQVRLGVDADRAVLSVEDDGVGIPSQDRDRMVRPFQRGEARQPAGVGTDRQKGYGLGLAIVARIAAWHRGTLTIDRSHALGGARIRVYFPMT